MSPDTSQTLLVELFAEELPPKSLKRLGEVFADELTRSLRSQGLASPTSVATGYATPRRLALSLTHVLAQAPDQAVEHKLMPVSVGLTEQGTATPALQKKLASLGAAGVDAAQLERRGDGKSETLVWGTTARGVELSQGLQAALDATLAKLPIAKVMSYQLRDGWSSVAFVRPAHRLVALHGSTVVPVSVLGLQAGRVTQGHRFEAAAPTLSLERATDYAAVLGRDGAVVASFAERKTVVVSQLERAAQSLGLRVMQDEALLDEVTALVEKPNVVACQFEEAFLSVPSECLVLTMKANQKYFPLVDDKGALTHRFLVVSNIAPSDTSRIVEGNERVVRPRLADAKFFFDKDRKASLESRLPMLDKVVYHAKLGSMGDRVRRIEALAEGIVRMLGWTQQGASVAAAAKVAKADLVTDMVGEFPELQGVMGGYYARHDGMPQDVAEAIEDHYKPRFAGDALPRGDVGTVVALADKVETLAGLFAAGERPTGDKDPFALRRHALGVIRLLIERKLALPLDALLDLGLRQHASNMASDARVRTQADLHAFVGERLDGFLRDQGHSAQAVSAVRASGAPLLREYPARLLAVKAFAELPEAQALAAANKRVVNILSKSSDSGKHRLDARLFEQAEETALAQSLASARGVADAAFERGEYANSLRALAALKGPVDAFFDKVMVNADKPEVRNNRLALLGELAATMNRVADLSKLAV